MADQFPSIVMCIKKAFWAQRSGLGGVAEGSSADSRPGTSPASMTPWHACSYQEPGAGGDRAAAGAGEGVTTTRRLRVNVLVLDGFAVERVVAGNGDELDAASPLDGTADSFPSEHQWGEPWCSSGHSKNRTGEDSRCLIN